MALLTIQKFVLIFDNFTNSVDKILPVIDHLPTFDICDGNPLLL